MPPETQTLTLLPSQSTPRIQLLLTPREAAKALRICERTLWTLTKSGGIPAVSIGRCVRYDPNDLTAWIEKQKTKKVPPAATGGNQEN